MLSHEKRKEMALLLLKHALNKEGAIESCYKIFSKHEVINGHEIIGLQERSNNEWWVFGVLFGEIKVKAIFTHYDDAFNFFFWKITRADTPWKYREEWEKETGLTF